MGDFYLVREVDPIRVHENDKYKTALKKIKVLKAKIQEILER